MDNLEISDSAEENVLGYAPCRCDVDLNFIVHVKQERVWVFQPPCDVRNDDVGVKVKTVPFRVHGHGQRHGMVRPVQPENALDLHFRVTIERDFARHPGGREIDLWIALAFQNFLVHLVVATLVSTLAAGSVDDNESSGGTRCRVEVNRSALEHEGSMHAVESGFQRETDLGVRGIEFERCLLGPKRSNAQAGDK